MFNSPSERLPLSRQSASLAAITAVLLVVAASRIIHITSLTMNWDEVWSIWQTFGSASDIIRWTPPDWPPLYFLFVGAWKDYAGIEPVVLRVSSLLVSMLGAAFTYRAARRLGGERAGLFTTLVYAALGFVIILGLIVRAYTFLLALTSLAIWLTLRYFERPSLWRALALTACCLALWFFHYTAAFVFPLLGLLTLFRYGRAIWRWWLPGGIVAIAAVYTVFANATEFSNPTTGSGQVKLPPLPQALAQVYGTFTYPAFLIWLVLFLIAGALLLARRAKRGEAVTFLVWLAGPLAVYLFNQRLGLFQDSRYMWWTLTGLIFWIGLGLALLPRRALQIAAALVITFVALIPFPSNDLQYFAYTDFDYSFTLLQQNIQPGDVLLIDPNCDCAPNEVWDYFMKIYFPNGLTFVKSPQG
ncbi:MAG TPA: glycosyltransferase family 39 protein, partial [Phototrophicaceae bacterium]|nr:glycosyltransferase family 39 protein [Phototrophicaceae bacterium]